MWRQHQRNGKGKTVAQKRKGERKKKPQKMPWGLIFNWQHLDILLFALPADDDFALYGAGRHWDSDRGPRPASAGSSAHPGKQYFSPVFTFLLIFYFFTDTRDLNGKMDFFFLLIPSSAHLGQQLWLASHRVNWAGLRINKRKKLAGWLCGPLITRDRTRGTQYVTAC